MALEDMNCLKQNGDMVEEIKQTAGAAGATSTVKSHGLKYYLRLKIATLNNLCQKWVKSYNNDLYGTYMVTCMVKEESEGDPRI